MKFLTNLHESELDNPENVSWLSDKLSGTPEATFAHTVEEIESMGMVGIYSVEDEAE